MPVLRSYQALDSRCFETADQSTRLKVLKAKNYVGEIAENTFLASLADGRVQQLKCAEEQITALYQEPKNLEKFIENYNAKLVLVAAEKKKMAVFKGAVDPVSLEEHKKARLRATAILESLPFAETASMRKIIEYITAQYEQQNPDRPADWLSQQNKNILKKSLSSALAEVKKNKAVMENGVNSFGISLDSPTRESLAQDTELIEAYKNQNPNLEKELQLVMCRVDAKYGRGAEYRDRTVIAVSVLGIGLGSLLTKAAAAGLSSSLTGAAAVGSVSMRTAGVLRVLATAGGTAASLQQSYKACFNEEANVTAKAGQGNAFMCEKNVLISQDSENCLLLATLDILGINSTAKVVKEALGQIAKGRTVATIATKPTAASTGSVKPGPALTTDPVRTKENPQVEIWRLTEKGALNQAEKLRTETEMALKTSKVKMVTDIQDSASDSKLIVLENGMQGIWKKSENFYSSGGAEVSAYRVDQKLGLNQVPITVEKEVDGIRGTVQLFVKGTDDVHFVDDPEYLIWYDRLIKNHDRHKKNYLTIDGKPVAIDNGFAFDHPNSPGDGPDFAGLMKKTRSPFENQTKKVQELENRLQNMAQQKGSTSSEYQQVKSQLDTEKKKQQHILIATKNNLSVILPSAVTYERLKKFSDQEWMTLLKDQLSAMQVNRFLDRKDEILADIEKAQKTFGSDIFRTGSVSPLVRQSNKSKNIGEGFKDTIKRTTNQK